MVTAAATARLRTTSVSASVGLPCSSAASGAMTSCFHSRSECSRANSRDSASRFPMRLTAMRKASSPAKPASLSTAIWSRRWPSSSSTSGPWIARRRRADTVAIARSALRAARGRVRPSCRACLHPETPQCAVYNLPLLPLESELRPALFGDAVVLALAAAFGRSPLGRDKTVPLQPVQHRVEHAVGPLQMAPRQFRHPLDDCIAITVTLGQDGQHQRRGGGGDQVLP